MKKILISSVSALALFAVPVFAQTNTSTVNQPGDNNQATAVQTGSAATSTITQTSDNNRAKATQSGNSSSSLIEQTGDNVPVYSPNNVADVVQVGDSDSIVRQSGVRATANVDQSGAGNSSTVNQSGNGAILGFSDLATYDETGVRQRGENNRSFVEQRGGSGAQVTQDNTLGMAGGNQSDVYQGTGNGSVDVDQLGGGNVSFVNQQTTACCGQDLPEAFVTQIGESNTGNIYQGTASAGSTARITQMANGNRSFITQDNQGPNGPAGSTAASLQTGDDNYSEISQQAAGNDADVRQSGVNNDSYVTQTGFGNTADVIQTSSDNLSTVNQGGAGNTATVTQGS